MGGCKCFLKARFVQQAAALDCFAALAMTRRTLRCAQSLSLRGGAADVAIQPGASITTAAPIASAVLDRHASLAMTIEARHCEEAQPTRQSSAAHPRPHINPSHQPLSLTQKAPKAIK